MVCVFPDPLLPEILEVMYTVITLCIFGTFKCAKTKHLVPIKAS